MQQTEENFMLQHIYVVAYVLNLTLMFALKIIYFLYSVNNVNCSLLNWEIVLFIIKSIFSKHFSKTLKKVKHF